MSRYTDANCKLCRREGQKLFLKGERCYSSKCAIERRNYAPGQHGQARKKQSDYGNQLREKQKAKRFYGMQETQFRNLFDKATKKAGKTGENLLILLETRLDNVVFRLGFAASRKEARQLVTHGHFTVNGKKVNIPSYLCKAGDVIEVRENKKSLQRFKDIAEVTNGRAVVEWLDVNADALQANVKNLPTREQIDVPVDEMLIVELYSK